MKISGTTSQNRPSVGPLTEQGATLVNLGRGNKNNETHGSHRHDRACSDHRRSNRGARLGDVHGRRVSLDRGISLELISESSDFDDHYRSLPAWAESDHDSDGRWIGWGLFLVAIAILAACVYGLARAFGALS